MYNINFVSRRMELKVSSFSTCWRSRSISLCIRQIKALFSSKAVYYYYNDQNNK